MRSNEPRQKTEFKHADLLASLIHNDDFWAFAVLQNGVMSRIPVYIKILQGIANAYPWRDLYQDPKLAREFMQACFDASGQELEKFEADKNNLPEDYVAMDVNSLAKNLYLAMHAAEKGDYQELEKLIVFYKKFLLWNFMGSNHLISYKSTSIYQLGELYAIFKDRTASANKPEFLILYELIIYITTSYKTKTDREKEGLELFSKCIGAIGIFARTVLAENPALFFAYFHNAKDLAVCLRQDSYGICFYDTNGKADVVKMKRCGLNIENEVSTLVDYILRLAFLGNHADKIFKSVNDIYEFLDILDKQKTVFSIGAPQEFNNCIPETFVSLIKRNQKLLKMIGNSKLAPEIYKLAPGIKKYCQAAVAYSHAGKGMLDARFVAWRNDKNDPLGQLPRDVVKVIANETDKLMKKDIDKQPKPPKSPRKS